MTIRPLCLRQLTFTGPGKKPAILGFEPGLNVIYGASDTGKSFILESIDFMLGGQTQLRDIPERVGYDRVALAIEDADKKPFTLFRSASGGNFEVLDGIHERLPAGAKPQVLGSKHAADNAQTVSYYLLEKIGLQDKRIRINKRNETNSLSFRNICPLTLVSEGHIQKQASPIESGQVIQRTREMSVFKLLLTGVDDSGMVSTAKVVAATQSAAVKLNFLDELLENYRSRIGDEDPNEQELRDQLVRLEASIEREKQAVQKTEKDFNSLVEHRTALRTRVQKGSERRVEIDELIARFGLLDTHYVSDLRRLEGIIEAGTLVDALTDGTCPLCGALPEHHNPKAECDGNVSLVVTAATAELDKINRLRRELADTVRQLGAEAVSFDRVVPKIRDDLSKLDREIQELLPTVEKTRSSYSDFVEKRSGIRSALALQEQIAELQQRRDIIEQGGENEPQATTHVTELPSSSLDKFAREIESILKAWHFPDAERVHFEEATRDIVIAGKRRGSRGKGMRAVTHAAFTIGLLEFCRKEKRSHPGFVVLDSPLLAYREPESSDDDLRETDVQECFYKFLAGLKNEQAIIIENVDPPKDIQSRRSSTFFSKNAVVGRYGFFPVENEEIDGT